MRTFELGEVIAERAITFKANAGWSRDVVVRLGRPMADGSHGNRNWMCPYQVAGLGRDRVMAIYGVDAMQALLLAIHTIPAELAAYMRDPGGVFLYFDAVETGFLLPCRNTLDLLGEVLRDDFRVPPLDAKRVTDRFFINVDLDIATHADPLPLVRALQPLAYSLERPPGRASFELNTPTSPTSPEPLIREFIRLVGLLPSDARQIWDKASRRVFDVGIQSLRRPFSETHSLSVETLVAAASVHAEIAFTVYSLVDDAGGTG